MIKRFIKAIAICFIVLNTGCDSNKKRIGYIIIESEKPLGFIKSEIVQIDGVKDMENFTNIIYGNYEVDKFESINFYVTDFAYDENEITQYIKTNIENNKELHKITIIENTISYRGQSIEIGEYSFLSNSATPYEYYDIEIYLTKDLEYDFPVAIKTRTVDNGDKILVEILINIEKYNYSFTTYVSYKRAN